MTIRGRDADCKQHDIITTICDYIDIWCLTIKHPHVEVVAANGEAKKSN